jgi:hypothetical protein
MSSASSGAKPRVQVFESTLGQYGKGAPFVGSHNVRTTTAVTAVTTRSRYPPGPTSQTHTPIRTACVPTMGRDPLTKMVTVVITGDSGDNGDSVDGGVPRWHATLPLDLAQSKLPHHENASGLASGAVPPPMSRRTPLKLLSNLSFHQSPYGAQPPHRAVLQRR